ncbi:hypothetical protein [Haloarcula pellucida]|uniref:Uncharacterized protein n=1 Tax=Haloarcula pellucida TaxID=1427151 RepID=A0A830GUX7_9EURY|nr:hypothetical protein [Halomicroarcula pellucida]MBX0350502.1 hypothetical protein [Halomicroarcula pellucida]GGO03619.1 hypothetical protein GCM10009030_39480 [Halomicroarcula pellucida]
MATNHRSNSEGDDAGGDAEGRYDRVLSVVEHNSGDPQLPDCLPRAVYKVLVGDPIGTGDYKRDDVDDSIRAAVNAGDLIVWRDRDGRKRLTRTLDADLRELIGHENEQEHPTTELIEQAARHIDDREATDE